MARFIPGCCTATPVSSNSAPQQSLSVGILSTHLSPQPCSTGAILGVGVPRLGDTQPRSASVERLPGDSWADVGHRKMVANWNFWKEEVTSRFQQLCQHRG